MKAIESHCFQYSNSNNGLMRVKRFFNVIENILYLSLLLTLFLASTSPFREYANRVEYVYDLWVNISILGEMFQNVSPNQKFGKYWFRVECDPG